MKIELKHVRSGAAVVFLVLRARKAQTPAATDYNEITGSAQWWSYAGSWRQ